MNANEIKKSGASIGAETETAITAASGDGLVARLLPVMRKLPKGKAVEYMATFWEQFDKNAPTASAMKRVKVTKSESLRIARGIDAGMDVQTGTWNDAVKASPNATSGKGAGGGRKPKTPKGPAEKTKEKPEEKTEEVAPTELFQRTVISLAALAHRHPDSFPSAWLKDLQALVLTVKQVPA